MDRAVPLAGHRARLLPKQHKELLQPCDMSGPCSSGHIVAVCQRILKRRIDELAARKGHFRTTSRISADLATLVPCEPSASSSL